MRLQTTRIEPFGLLVEPGEPGQNVRDIDAALVRQWAREEQLVLLRGFETFGSGDELSDYCGELGEVSQWPFGTVLNLVEQDNPEDHIFDNNHVPLHWDGMYRPQVPELQVFHCVAAPPVQSGGRTTFSNTQRVLANASPETRATWDKVTGTYRREMEFYSSTTVSPIITQHPCTGADVIRYNEPTPKEDGDFLNPPDLKFEGLAPERLDSFHRELQAALKAPGCYYAHQWQTGDVVIADNFALLHGREGFASKAPRHLQRVHVLSDPPFNNPGLEAYQCPAA